MSGQLSPSTRKRAQAFTAHFRPTTDYKPTPVEAALSLMEAMFSFNHMEPYERSRWMRHNLPMTYAFLSITHDLPDSEEDA